MIRSYILSFILLVQSVHKTTLKTEKKSYEEEGGGKQKEISELDAKILRDD